MPHTVAERITRWGESLRRPEYLEAPFSDVQEHVAYLARRLYAEYEPTRLGRHPEFQIRLRDWLDSAPAERDQKIMFQALRHVFFIGSNEFDSLRRTAFNGPVRRWLIDLEGLRLDDPHIEDKLSETLRGTWLCPITDSMQISRFYHVNNITGTDLRPDWRVLKEFGELTKIRSYMTRQRPPLARLVLLEDFVGEGEQMEKALRFAATLPGHPPVLFCPLVICPGGSQLAATMVKQYPNLTFEPVLEVSSDMFLHAQYQVDEPPLFTALRECVQRLHYLVGGSTAIETYTPFGFRGRGAMIVLYTNCPDNTLPMIHHESDGPWRALFPRSSRL